MYAGEPRFVTNMFRYSGKLIRAIKIWNTEKMAAILQMTLSSAFSWQKNICMSIWIWLLTCVPANIA